MKKIDEKIRQIEILVSCISGRNFSKNYFAEYYQVEEITINRDLSAIKKLGINIYSSNKKIEVNPPADPDLLMNLYSEYLSKKGTNKVSKAIRALNQINAQAVYFPVIIEQAISTGQNLRIEYSRISDRETGVYILKPVELRLENLNYILFAVKENATVLQQFYVSRMSKCELSEKNIVTEDSYSENVENYKIVLEFPKEKLAQVSSKIWFENFSLEYFENTVQLSTESPITNYLAGWCVSWWGEIRILEPVELQVHINAMIKAFQKAQKVK